MSLILPVTRWAIAPQIQSMEAECFIKIPLSKTKRTFMNQLRIRRRIISSLMFLLMAAWQIGQPLQGATFFWDPDADGSNSAVGGTGTWDITAFQWDVDADNSNSNNVAWLNGIDIASFGGTAGTVTLGVPITVGGLEFTSDGYTITGTGLNTLTLSGAGTIDVAAGVHAAVTADIAGAVGLVKNGLGTLNLGPSNSFTGSTIINAGVVEVYKDDSLGSGSGALVLNGGTLSALGNNFYSTRNVNVGAGGGTLAVSRNLSNFGSMRLQGVISGAGTLTKTGFGELRLDGDSSGFTGTFVLDQGIVRLNGYTDRGSVINDMPSLGASRYDIHAGGDLMLHYASLGATPYYSAINETAPIHMEGGRIYYLSNNSGAVSPWTQNLGDLFLDAGSNRFLVQRQSTSSATLMSFGNLTHAAGATADFRGQDSSGVLLTSLGTLGNQPLIKFANSPVANDGILGGWATVNLSDFADYDPTYGVRYATYTSTDITTAGATDNVNLTEGGGIFATIGDTIVNSIRWTATASTSTLEQADGSTLTIDTGGLLMLGNYNKRIQPASGTATIKANGGALYIYNNQGTLTIDSIIADGDQPTALVKSQAASLTLNGANTYSGGTYLNGGNNLNTGTTAGVTYLGTGAVFVTGGILVQSRPGATSSTQGYTVTRGGYVLLNSTQSYTMDGDRYTVSSEAVIGGQSTTNGGLNSLTYVAGAVSAGGEVHIDPGATVMHHTNSTAMGTGTNTIQGLPNNMDFYFGEGTTQTATSGVTIGVGTPWKGLGTDRNTRGWDQGTITVNGSDFELHGLLAPSVNGESQSAYVLRLGNNTAGVVVAGFPTITGAAATPLNAHVTGGFLELMDDEAVYGDTSAGSPLTFLVEAGAGLQISATNAMGSGNGLATIQVRDGGTLQQYYSTSNATAIAISATASSGINGSVTVQSRGRFLAQNANGLDGIGIITFEPRAILQINNATGWTGSQAEAAVGINDAIIRIQADNFGEASKPLLTNYGIDGTGIYEWATNANAANPTAPNTPILSLDGGLIINDAFDRSLDLTANGFIELKAGGAGGTIASSSGQLFNINEDVELNGLMLTIGYADVIDGDPGLGDVRMDKVTDSVGTGTINVISGAQLRISLTDAIQSDIDVTLQAGAWLDIDEAQTLVNLFGNGATSRILGDNYLTLTRAGDYDLNASLGDNMRLTQDGGGVLTLIQNADGNGILGATNGTLKIGTGVSIGTAYTLNPTGGGIIDLNGQTVGAASLTGDSTGVIELNGGVLEFNNAGTVTIAAAQAAINGPGIIRLLGEGQVRFNLDDTRMTNISQIDIFNGEFRVDGTAGSADSFLIGAPVINLGDHFVTTGGTGSQVFPRLYLVNAETTQTATLNVDGGWITSDLGTLTPLGVGMDIWSGNIVFTGEAATNLFDVNDTATSGATARTAPEEHYVSGIISGTGGFSKINIGSLILIADNTIQGDIYVQRAGPAGAALDSQGGLVLSGAAGAFSDASAIILSRDGSFYLDNAATVLDQGTNGVGRVANDTQIELRAAGRLRVVSNSAAAVHEDLGALLQATGSGKVNFDFDDTTQQFTKLTFDSYTRTAGSITQFQVLDNLAGEFGSRTGSANRAELHFTDMGASALLRGGGGANGSTNQTLIVGAFGGVNNISNHFMTFDSVNTTELRPLQWDGDANAEYFLSRTGTVANGGIAHQFTQASLGTLDQNVNINYNVLIDGDISQDPAGYGWYGAAPIAILEDVAMNSLRFGTNTPTSTVNTTNSNEIGSALVLAPGAHLYLGDSLAVNTGLSGDTNGSGMILFGRDVLLSNPGSNQYIAGGIIDFGSREAVIVNESGNSALFRTDIHGTGGLTKAGAQTVYLDNSNSYSGTTTIAEGILDIRDQHALGNSNLVVIEGAGQLYLELGTNVLDTASGGAPPDLFVGINDASRTVLYSNSANNTWGGDVIIDNVDNAGNWVFSSYIGTNALYTLNINGDIYGNELLNPINTDTALNDARLLGTNGINSAGGVINLNGQFRDNSAGAIAAPVTTENENQLLRFFIRGSDQAVVNARQQWDAAGLIFVENGILRYEGDGNFWTAQAAANMNSTNGQSGLRIGGNSNNWNAAVILTKAGQVLNIGRIDIGGDGTNDYNQFGNDMLAGTNTSGTVTFGDGTETIRYNGSSSANNFVRDLTVYQAGGGTMELNFRLDDTDADSHTSFTKIGRGVVNFNGQNDVNGAAQNGDVEQLNMSGGLLRLTNYGFATGRRFDTGAMITFAGGGLEMDGTGAIQDETANYTGAAVGAASNFPLAQTLIAAGGTDVIVTSKAGRIITMNIGSTSLATNRQTGGTLNFVENSNGGSSVITFLGSGGGSIQADDTAYAWATYGDTYAYDAASASYTVNALDFAMTTGGLGDITLFTAASRENTDDVSTWTIGNDVSELLGFTGTTAAAAAVNTIHFDADAAGTITVDVGGLIVTSGGIMVSSLVATDTSTKTITGGPISAGGTNDLIIHQYGASTLTIDSVIQDATGPNALVKTGSGELILTGVNTYTGSTFLNGGQLTISSNTNLGATPGAPDADNIYANGGTLRVLSDVELDANRGMQLGGNGIEISVGPGSTLTFNGIIASEPNVITNYVANPAVGRIDKTGLGTLLLTNISNTYNGLTEVRQGTLMYAPAFTASTTPTAFGSNSAFLDGTIVRSGATLVLHPSTPTSSSNFNAIFQEWFTFEGGSTLNINPVNTAGDPHDINYYFRGIIQLDSLGNAGTPDGFQTPSTLAGAVIFDVGNQGSNNINDAGGYITGDGGITKIGPGQLNFRENNPEWTGQLIINQGSVVANSAGNPLGVGTLPIILGHNLLAELAGEPDSGNGTVYLLFQDEGGYRDVSSITQDIIVRADDGAGAQTKRIGAWFMANVDVVNYDGSLTLRDDLQLYYRDDVRDSSLTTSNNINNSNRSIGTLGNAETIYINFNGGIIGAAGNDITTVVDQNGTANVINGSITAPNDDFVIRAIFGLNGDNSGWAGNLVMGNTTSDVDTQHIVSVGNVLGLSANNNVTLRNNATLQTSGNNIVIGSLLDSGTGLLDNFIENASTTAGSITITQAIDATVEVVLRDGVNFFQLQPGEVDAALSFVKRGDAALTLVKGNTFTGSTTLDGGTLRLAYNADNSMLSDTAALILNDGILDLAGTVAHNEIVASTTINGSVAIERSTGATIIHLNTITRNIGTLRISEDGIATTDTLNTNGILGVWATVGGSWATNSTNGADGAITGLTTFADVDRLGGIIANDDSLNVRIIEAGAGSTVTLAGAGLTAVNTLLQGANGGTALVEIGTGNTLRIATGGVLLPDGSTGLTLGSSGTGTLTAGTADDTDATLFLLSQSSTGALLTVGTVLADNGTGVVTVRTTGPGTTVFTGANTYTGQTLVGSGILAIGDGGMTGTLGSGDVKVESSAILALNRSDTSLIVAGKLTGTGVVAQNGAGTTTLNGATDVTALNFFAVNGTLASGVDNAINTTGSLTFGDTAGATTTATVDLTNGSATIGGLLVQTNTATANQIIIGTGKTLTTQGDVTIGYDGTVATASPQSVLTVTGGGTWLVNQPSGTFQVGGATTDTFGSKATIDMSGLSTFTADLGSSGVFRVGDNAPNGPGSGNDASTVTLADVNTITAALIGLGDAKATLAGDGTLNLGSISNVLNADRIAVGDNVLGRRGTGVLQFDTATGTVKIRASDGTGRAILDVLNSAAGTGNSLTGNIVNFAGHDADLLLSSLTIGARNAGNGAGGAAMTFDTGMLDVTTITIGRKSGGSGTATTSGTLNIGGGTVIVGIGGIVMGQNSAGDTASTGAGTLNITGGAVSVDGDIVHVGTTGGDRLSSATLNLDGGNLDMKGHNIGDATNAVANTFASGTLKNVAEINGGGGLTKTTTGKLILDGVNTYTGTTTVDVDGGILQFAKQTAFYNNTTASWTATNLVVNSGGTAAFNVGGVGEFTAGDLDIIKDLGTTTGGFLGDSTLGIDTSNAAGTFTYGGVIADTDSGSNSIGLHKLGSGTLEVTGSNTYTGKTTVSGGTLSISADENLGTAPGGPVADQLTLAGGTLQVTADATLNANRGITIGAGGGSFETADATTTTVDGVITGGGALTKDGTGSLIFTAANTHTGTTTVNAGVLGGTGSVGGDLTVASGGTLAPGVAGAGQFTVDGSLALESGGSLALELGGATANDAAVIRDYFDTNGSLAGLTIQAGYEAENTGLHDFISIGGAAVPDFSGTVKLTTIAAYNPVYGDIFDLLDWAAVGSATGAPTFDFSMVALDAGLAFNTDLFASNGIVVIVPEPSRALLLLLGLLGLMLRRRRR